MNAADPIGTRPALSHKTSPIGTTLASQPFRHKSSEREQISLKRKQQAIRSVGPLATDAADNPAPFTGPASYQRESVAVPVRQRHRTVQRRGRRRLPDPVPVRRLRLLSGPTPPTCRSSGEHLAGLRADRESALAIGAADYVVANLAGEIGAFAAVAAVADTMRLKMSELDPPSAPRSRKPAGTCAGPGRPHPAADRHHLPRHGRGMTATSRTQAMLAARAKASQDERERALAAVQALEAAGTPVTATVVATAAGCPHLAGLRQRRPSAVRSRPPSPGRARARLPPRGEPATHASLRTDLAVARDEIRRLRAERDKLHPPQPGVGHEQ